MYHNECKLEILDFMAPAAIPILTAVMACICPEIGGLSVPTYQPVVTMDASWHSVKITHVVDIHSH
jgi:hypothetical protein